MTLSRLKRPDLGSAPSTSEIITQHLREAIEACRARDMERAVKLLDEHIAGVCATLLEHLPRTR